MVGWMGPVSGMTQKHAAARTMSIALKCAETLLLEGKVALNGGDTTESNIQSICHLHNTSQRVNRSIT